MSETWRVLPALWRMLVVNTPEITLSLAWNLFLAITPAIALLCLFYEQDPSPGKSGGARLRVFVLGLTTVIPALLLEIWCSRTLMSGELLELEGLPMEKGEFTQLLRAFLLGFILSATIEELVKIYYLSFVKQMKVVNNRKAVIVYAVLLGLAFASAENISYVLTYHSKLPAIGIGRALIALPMHVVCAVLMGYFVGEAEFTQSQAKPLLYFRAWAIATLIHGSYNTMLFSGLVVGWMVALFILVVSLVVALVLCWRLRRGELPQPNPLRLPGKSIASPSGSHQQLAHKISALLNRSLKDKGMTAKVTAEGDRHLEVLILSSKTIPTGIAAWIHQGLVKLELSSIQSIRIVSRQFGVDLPQWQQQFELSGSKLAVSSRPPIPSVKSNSQSRTHRGFSLMAVLFGFLADICSTYLIFLIIGVGLGIFSTTQQISEADFDQLLQAPRMNWVLLGLGCFCSMLGGLIAAHLAGRFEMRHALGSGILSMLHGFALYSALESDYSAWFDGIAILLAPPAAILGGILRQQLRRFQLRRPESPVPSHP